MAKDICKLAPLAVRAAKQAMTRSLSMPLEEGLRFEDLLVKNLRKTEDVEEGLKAFAEKRKPIFKGK